MGLDKVFHIPEAFEVLRTKCGGSSPSAQNDELKGNGELNKTPVPNSGTGVSVSLRLADGDVAGACVGVDGGAAAVDGSADVVTVQAALHGDGLGDVDGA